MTASRSRRHTQPWSIDETDQNHARVFWCPICWAEDGGFSGAGTLSVNGDESVVEASQRHWVAGHPRALRDAVTTLVRGFDRGVVVGTMPDRRP